MATRISHGVDDGTVEDAEARRVQGTPKRPPLKEFGTHGTNISGGYLTGLEDNTALDEVEQRCEAYEKMLRTDEAIAAGLDAFIATGLSASWMWESPKGASSEPAEYLNRNFGFGDYPGLMSVPHEDQLAAALLYDPFGFRYMEKVWAVSDGAVVLSHLADREPSAHRRWVTDSMGRLAYVEQDPPESVIKGYGEAIRIPASKVVLLTRRKTGANFEGVGSLRSIYHLWRIKKHLKDMLAVGAERWAVPTPRVRIRPGVLFDSAASLQSDPDASQVLGDSVSSIIATLKGIARDYASHQQKWLMDVDGAEIEAFGQGAFRPEGIIDTINHISHMMLTVWGLQFLKLGITDTGSRSVGEVHETFHRRGMVNVLDKYAAAMSGPGRAGGGVCGDLMAWNFPGLKPEEYPRLKHSGLNVEPLAAHLSDLPALIQAMPALKRRALVQKVSKVVGVDCDINDLPDDDEMQMGPIAAAAARMPREPVSDDDPEPEVMDDE